MRSGADARAGRLRLPLAELDQAQVQPEEPAQQPWRAPLVALVRRGSGSPRGLGTRRRRARPVEQAALPGLLVWAALAAAHSRRALAALPDARVPGDHLPRWMAGAPGAPRAAPPAGVCASPRGDF